MSATGISVNGYEPEHLSYSSIDGYKTCGKRFELQKIIGVEQRPGLAALGGNAVHLATQVIDLLMHEHGDDWVNLNLSKAQVRELVRRANG